MVIYAYFFVFAVTTMFVIFYNMRIFKASIIYINTIKKL